MSSILEHLFYQHDCVRKADAAALQRIAANSAALKKDFSKRQKKILLGIIDDKDSIAYDRACDSFASGVRYGVLFMLEILDEPSNL